MKNVGRSILLATTAITVAAGVPAAVATAAADVTGSVRTIAERAAELTVEEQSLLETAMASDLAAADRAELEARIRTVDARGAEMLTQLDRLDVDLTQAIRATLGELAPLEEWVLRPDALVPSPEVYEAATADLMRIADTPGAVTSTPTTSSSPAFGLLAVAAVSLLALGAAALGNSLRRQPDPTELEAMAWSDGLTGLANRRKLDADLSRHDDAHVETAVVMVDIDDFEGITDAYGHTMGDEILRRVASLLSQQVRYDDIVYRYGGEEFCVLLRGATAEDANDVADRIVSAVRGIELPGGGNVTVSVGVAGTGGDAIDAVQRADRALYAAKEQGQDQAIPTA